MKYTKQRRQVNRLLKNQTKSTILCLKQYCNNSNKKLLKDKSISDKLREKMIDRNNELLKQIKEL